MGFVVIQHLDPTHESQLSTLLKKNCSLTVIDSVHGAVVIPNHVYVITPNTRLQISKGALVVGPRDQGAGSHHPIDMFMESLAKDCPAMSIGVILSGTGTDGTLGISAIKAAGGITFAQDNSAEYPGMPLNAVGQGNIDFVLKPIEIARELAKIAHFGFPLIPLDQTGEHSEASGDAPDPSAGADDPEEFTKILELLRKATGIDFTHYRPTTITRRTRRRMALISKTTLSDYARYLVDMPGEIDYLAKDILIHVTSFFRDKSVFEAVKVLVLPAIVDRRPSESSIRLWIVGCSTGQEVYSLAIQLIEHLRNSMTNPQVQIFVTDISDWALAKARLGYYPEAISGEIPSDLLARYFTKEASGYRVTKMLRDLCVFAKHDVTSDTPFSRIDLISCRNVLIYLGPVLQKYVLPTFHFALNPGGFLILGTSETLGQSTNLYETFDEKHHIYRSMVNASRVRPTIPQHRISEQITQPAPMSAVQSDSAIQRAADQILLGRFAPPGVLINESMDVVQYRGRTHPFLEPAPGEPSRNLLTMVPFGVSQALREAVVEARRLNLPIRRDGIAHRRDQAFREISFEVIPIRLPQNDTGYLILFEETGLTASHETHPNQSVTTSPDLPGTNSDQREIDRLRTELAAASDYVRSLLGLNQAQHEELKDAQQEAQSTTEEFRSTNEELQTAKEEVESTNQELITINEELRFTSAEREKISNALRESGELTAAIVETMRYPLLILTSELRVDSTNQAFLDAFAADRKNTIGFLIYDLVDGQWNIPELRRLLEDILPNNSEFDDFEVTQDFPRIGRRTMLLNARRLQGIDDRSRRIVLVIADITERRRIAAAQEDKSSEQLRSNSELEQFAAVAAHDLQEPLRMVACYLGILNLQYGPQLDDRARGFMTYATEGARRMAEMINAILAYSQLGHELTVMAECDCGQAVKDAMSNLTLKIDEAQAVISAESLPCIKANREQITQLFQNLIGNSVKYHSTERTPKITISAHGDDNEWIISVSDNGIGMRESDYLKIFLPYQRAGTDKFVKGCGIGLATCKKIVNHHRGRIWVTSRLDVGSTFSFTIPK